MQLKHKLPLILFVAYVALTGSLVAFALANSSKTRKAAQFDSAKATARNYSDKAADYFLERLSDLKSLESGIQAMADLDDEAKAKGIAEHLKKLSNMPSISDAYAVFERGGYFSEEATKPGFYYLIEVFHPLKGGTEVSFEESEEVKSDDDYYNVPKATKKNYLAEPYKWAYPGESTEREMVSLSYPLFVNGKFVGVLGMDMELGKLQKEVFGNMQGGRKGDYVTFVSSEGVVAAHPKHEMLFSSIDADTPEDARQGLKDAIKKGESHLVIRPERNGDNTIITYVPMQPKGLDIPWSIGYAVSHAELRGDEIGIRNRTVAQLILIDILWGIFLIWLMSNVFGHLTRVIAAVGKMTDGNGDLTIRLAKGGKDEIGQMSRGLNSLIEKLHSTIKMTQKEAKSLLGTSSALYDLSRQLFESSETAFAQSAEVSKSTEAASESAKAIAGDANKTSSHSSELASTAEQMSVNMNSVASAVEELSASFAQITSNTDESRMIATEATEKATEATSVMNKLGNAAKEIGQVTNVIKSIADKTNLLALNATIEAASAGEAGKGFAVVAGEIKELANQSAKSADDIARRIEDIQNGTHNAVHVIKNVSDIIGIINSSIDSIANSVEQQTKASNEIASNAEQASVGAKRVVSEIGEVAQTAKVSAQSADNVADGTKNISESVNAMHEDAKMSNANSAELEKTANTLKSMAESLDAIVSKFRT